MILRSLIPDRILQGKDAVFFHCAPDFPIRHFARSVGLENSTSYFGGARGGNSVNVATSEIHVFQPGHLVQVAVERCFDGDQIPRRRPLLCDIMKKHKNYTGRGCNQLIGETDKFWNRETYDHLVRNQEEFDRIAWYILRNPVKARLVEKWQDWPYTYAHPDLW